MASRATAFEEAAEAAKRDLYPELYFSTEAPSISICRVCAGPGYHKENCKLIRPDGKERAFVEDILTLADKPEEKRKLEVPDPDVKILEKAI